MSKGFNSSQVDEFSRRGSRTTFLKAKKGDYCETVEPGTIKCKIDWFTVIFYDCSVRQALTSLCGLHLPDGIDFDRTFNDRFLSSQGYLPDFVFNFNGVACRVAQGDVFDVIPESQVDSCDSFKFFDLHFRKVRLEVSGSGLDVLRSEGIDVDTLFFRPLPMQTDIQTYHVTRVDVAFDLLDYQTDFLDRCISWCAENGNNMTHRIAVGASGGGLKYSFRLGDQKTLYLGAGTSDRLLRVYDKGLQYETSKQVIPYVYEDGTFPSSWIRIELQTRREVETSKILYSHPDFQDSTECFLGVFRYIYDRFGFYKDGKTVDLWLNLFDWDKIPGILNKSLILSHHEPNCVRAKSYVQRSAFSSIVIYLAEYGWKSFQEMINHQFIAMQRSLNPCDKMRFTSQLIKILDGRASLPDFIYRDKDGFYYIGNPV